MAMFHLDDVVDGEFPSSVEGPPHRRKGCSEIDQLIDSFLHFDHPLGTRLDNTDDKLENSSQGRPDQNWMMDESDARLNDGHFISCPGRGILILIL